MIVKDIKYKLIKPYIPPFTQASRKLSDPDKKEATTGYIVRHIDRYLSHYKDLERGTFARLKVAISRVTRIMCGKKYGNYLAILYLCIKVSMFSLA